VTEQQQSLEKNVSQKQYDSKSINNSLNYYNAFSELNYKTYSGPFNSLNQENITSYHQLDRKSDPVPISTNIDTNSHNTLLMRQKTLLELNDDLGNIFQSSLSSQTNLSSANNGLDSASMTKASKLGLRNHMYSSNISLAKRNSLKADAFYGESNGMRPINLDIPLGSHRLRSASFGEFGELSNPIIEQRFGRLFRPADETIPGSPDFTSINQMDKIIPSPVDAPAVIPIISYTPPTDEFKSYEKRSRSSSFSDQLGLPVRNQRSMSASTSNLHQQDPSEIVLSRPSSRRSLVDEMIRPVSRLSVDDQQDLFPAASNKPVFQIGDEPLSRAVSRAFSEITEPVPRPVSRAFSEIVRPVSRPFLDIAEPMPRPVYRAVSEIAGPVSRAYSEIAEPVPRPVSRAVSEIAGPVSSRPFSEIAEPIPRPVSRAVSEIAGPVSRALLEIADPVFRPVSRAASEISVPVSRPVPRPLNGVPGPALRPVLKLSIPAVNGERPHPPVIKPPSPVIRPPSQTFEAKSPRLSTRRPRNGLYKSLSRTSIYEEPDDLDDVDVYHTINGAGTLTNTRPALPFAKIHRRTARQVAHGLPSDAFTEVEDNVGGVPDCETESVFSFCEDNSCLVRNI
jgi:hypothetical protein